MSNTAQRLRDWNKCMHDGKESMELLKEAADELERLTQWVADCQSGMYVNCVYCGHRYGPKEDTPVAMADILKQHIEQCPAHPMSELKRENERLKAQIARHDLPEDY